MKTEERPGAALRRHLALVTIGGCLAMVYASCVESSFKTKLFEDLRATDFQFGLLTGLPVVAVALQFVGAYLQMSGLVRRRKSFFMLMLIACRLLLLPIALLPVLMPDASGTAWVIPFILIITVSAGMNHLATPMWLSWIGDIVPERVLSRFWAERQRYMQLVWTAAFLAVAAFAMYCHTIPVRTAFALLALIGLVAGVADIVLFVWVREPAPAKLESVELIPMLTEPFRDPNYRRVIAMSTVFSFATWAGGGFMLVFTLKELHVPVWKANMMWCLIGIGGAMIARTWGRLIDKHGQRPVMMTVMLAKPWVALVFVFATPENAFWMLSIALFLDSMANCGYVIAMNGFMLRAAPPETRAMFVAATQAINGIAGGLGAILGGVYLAWVGNMKFEFAGLTWGNYQLLFFMSFSLRLVCVNLAARIREPTSSPTGEVLGDLLDQWPPRLLTYPYALYKRLLPGGTESGGAAGNREKRERREE